MGIPGRQQLKHFYDQVLKRTNETSSVIPAQRSAFKKGYSFSALPFTDQLVVWDHIWSQGPWLARLQAYLFLEQSVRKKELHAHLWATSVRWQDLVTDWALCDALAKINTKVLESHPTIVYKQLTRWNKDRDLYKRRQSVVSLLYFSRTKTTFLSFDKIVALIKPLLNDGEYYVQKGVGWALRETHAIYPSECLQFITNNILSIHPIAFTIAIEKMGAEKNDLKAFRKTNR